MMTPDAACASIHGLVQAVVSQPEAFWQNQHIVLTVTFDYAADAKAFHVTVNLGEKDPQQLAGPSLVELLEARRALPERLGASAPPHHA